MATREWIGSFPKCSLLLILPAVLFAIGLWDYLFKSYINDCQMTYMFEYPEFTKIQLPSQVKKRFPSYNLYVYGEGLHAAQLQAGRFSGQPVLFIPGNAGSYKQVRSIASVSHRMYQEGVKPFELDFFALDLNEQKAGLFGQLLQDQVLFAAQAVQQIQKLYQSHGSSETSCIVIGHSIGGVIARSLLLEKTFTPSCIQFLLTLAAPHDEPVVRFDDTMSDFYANTNSKWAEERKKNGSKISHIIHVSIAGGFNDVLVRSQLAKLPDNGIDFSAVSTGIPDAWLPVDHLCIIWCKQFIIKLSRLIYDVIDAADIERKSQVIRYHLETRNRGKMYPNHIIPKIITFPQTGTWILFHRRMQRYTSSGKILSPIYILIKLQPNTMVFVSLNGEHRHDWIAACDAQYDQLTNQTRCESGINLSPESSIIPGSSDSYPRSIFKSSSDALNFTHVLVSLTPQVNAATGSGASMTVRPSVSLITERFPSDQRKMGIFLPSLMSSLLMPFSTQVMLEVPVSQEASFYNLSLIGLTQVWHVYAVTIETGSCYEATAAKESSIAHFHVPWNREDVFAKINYQRKSSTGFVLKLNVPRQKDDIRSASLLLYLDPDCGYKVKIQLYFTQMLGQITRFYYQYLMQFMAAIIASVAGLQMVLTQSKSSVYSVSEDDEDSSHRLTSAFVGQTSSSIYHHESAERILRRNFFAVLLYGLLPVFPCLALFLMDYFAPIPMQSSSPLKYIKSLEQPNLTFLQFTMLFSAISLAAYGITYVSVLLVQASLNLISCVALRCVTKSEVTNYHRISNTSNSGLTVAPFFISLVLVLITVSTTSALGFLLTFLVHAVKCILMHVSSSRDRERRGLSISSTVSHVHVTIGFLLALVNFASFPLLLYWIFQCSCRLFLFFPQNQLIDKHDPHLFPCLIVICCMSLLWQGKALSAKATSWFDFAILSSSRKKAESNKSGSSCYPKPTGCRGKAASAMRLLIRSTGLLMSASCHNLFLMPHYVAVVIFCMTLNTAYALSDAQDQHHHHQD